MLQSTLKAALQETIWNRDRDNARRYTAAQDAARLLCQQAADVSAAYSFARDDDNCLFLADGTAVQMAMRLTHTATGRAVSVVCKLDGAGDALWFVLDMSAAPFEAAAYIKAVQGRIENNRRAD